jgi:hypothetical protein
MMYLVDLDDSTATVLTIQEGQDAHCETGYSSMPSEGFDKSRTSQSQFDPNGLFIKDAESLDQTRQRIALLEAQLEALETRQQSAILRQESMHSHAVPMVVPSYEVECLDSESNLRTVSVNPSKSLEWSNSRQSTKRTGSSAQHSKGSGMV